MNSLSDGKDSADRAWAEPGSLTHYEESVLFLNGRPKAGTTRRRRTPGWGQYCLLALGSCLLLLKGWQTYTTMKGAEVTNPFADKNVGSTGPLPGKGVTVLNLTVAHAEFDWGSLTPSENLVWTSCHDVFQCARLSVPLDYSEPKGEKAAVAIIKYPSKVAPTAQGYRGPVLFNPGGPGGSGVQMVLGRAEAFRAILGDDYDLIGFDPRGVGFTTPGMFTFPSKPEGAYFIGRAERAANETEVSLGKLYANLQILGDIAEERLKGVAEHVSTPVVARDMLSIVKAHGLDKLQYWGFSYGTVLGATFAAMFPDNVGRIIIDGVVDSENYYEGLWSNNLRDTDAGLFHIYQACVEAGPVVCPIYEPSADKINTRVNTLLEKLKIHPITYYNSTSGAYGILDYSAAKSSIFTVLYNAHKAGARLTQALADAEKGVGQPLYDLSARVVQSAALQCDCPARLPDVPFSSSAENTMAIACGDAGPLEATLDEAREFYEEMGKSSTFAEIWWIHLACVGWKIEAKERLTAKFEANTSFPLLLIGNTADPVTPLWNAHKMSKGFNNSVVLTQDSPGHCSLAAVSSCTAKAIREYFREGKLPEEGTVCTVQSSVFGDVATKALSDSGLSPEEVELLKASEMLGEEYFVPVL